MTRYVEAAPKGAERRTSPRVDLEIEVTLDSESNFFTGLTHDISTGGLFVSTHRLRKIGQHMVVRFTLPGSSVPVVVECEVRWLREAGPLHDHRAFEQPAGMGLKFLNLAHESKQAISHFLKSRESIFYDDE